MSNYQIKNKMFSLALTQVIEKETKKEVSISESLFKQEKIVGISFLTGGIGYSNIKPYWAARVSFVDGDVRGEKQFKVEGLENFYKIVKLVEEFTENL